MLIYDRMDWMLPTFGWFHLVMAFMNSLHKQYLSTSASIGGLQQAFDVLQQKGLQKPETKGIFWAHLNEALRCIGEAHLHASWLVVAGILSLSDLRSKSPLELHHLAVQLYKEHPSRYALMKMDERPESKHDHVQMQFTM